jgi:UDP-N-acetylglucosamine 2-epimerase (non-hydrolysing)
MANIARALGRIADRPDTAILFPVHPNPNVVSVMDEMLGRPANIARIDPLDYPHFVRALGLARSRSPIRAACRKKPPRSASRCW